MYQVELLRQSEAGPTLMLIFQFSRYASYFHHLGPPPFEEPLLGTLSFRFEAVLHATFDISRLSSTSQTFVFLMIYEADPYLLCFARWKCISYVLGGGSLYNVVTSLESSYALKTLFLFDTMILSSLLDHPFS